MLKQTSIKIVKYLISFIILGIIFFALMINAARVFLPLIIHERSHIEKLLSQQLQQTVTIEAMETTWRGFDPVLYLKNVRLYNASRHETVKIKSLGVGLDLINSLLHFKILPSYLQMDNSEITLHQTSNKKFIIEGIPLAQFSLNSNPMNNNFKERAEWLLSKGNINLKNISLHYIDQNGARLSFPNVHLEIANHHSKHEFFGKFNLNRPIYNSSESNSEKIRFFLRFSHPLFSDQPFDGQGYLNVYHFSLRGWEVFPELNAYASQWIKLQELQGGVSANVWVHWKNGKISEAQSIFSVEKIKLNLKKYPQLFEIDSLKGNIAWNRLMNGWNIKANQFSLKTLNINWKNKEWAYQYLENKGVYSHLFNMNKFQLSDIVSLSSLKFYSINSFISRSLVPSACRGDFCFEKILLTLHPKGELENVKLFWQTDSLNPHPIINFSSIFKNIEFNAWRKIPAVKNLSGYIYYSPEKGFLEIHSKKATLFLSQLFSHAFENLNIQSNIHWAIHNHRIHLHLENYFLSDHNLSINGSGLIDISSLEKIRLKIFSGFHMEKANGVVNYMPKQILTPGLKKWMVSAFQKGKLKNGVMIFQGPLNKFPFDHHEGRFEIQSSIQNMTMCYFPGWPVFSNINGIIRFEGKGMSAIIHGGDIAGNPMNVIKAKIPNMQHTVLSIQAFSNSDLSHALDFLIHSPLSIGKSLSVVHFHGPMKLNIHLKVVIRKKNSTVLSHGNVDIHEGVMEWPAVNIQVNHIHGGVNFINANLSGKNIVGSFLNEPVHFNLSTLNPEKKTPIIQIHMNGKLNLEKLTQTFHLPLLNNKISHVFLKGTTHYQGVLKIRNGGEQKGDIFKINSNLVGVSIHGLPAPYNKSAKIIRNFSGRLGIDKNEMKFILKYSNLFSTALTLSTIQDHFQLRNLDFHFGASDPRIFSARGIKIDGNLDTFDWNNWDKFLERIFAHTSGATFNDLPFLSLSLGINHFKYHDFSLDHLFLNAIPQSKEWIIQLKNKEIGGTLYVPPKKNEIWHINLDHLIIPLEKSIFHWNKNKKINFNPSQFPSLDLKIKNFQLDKINFGVTHLRTTKMRDELIIRDFSSQSADLSTHLIGRWNNSLKNPFTFLQGQIFSKDYGKLLTKQNISQRLSKGRGVINFSLRWKGGPTEFDIKKIKGYLKANLSEGVILMPNAKMGAELDLGQLINIFSVQSLLRHLTFNFTDLTNKGLMFNSLKSEFIFDHGIAYTQSSQMSGPLAKVIVSGTIDFNLQANNIILTVDPVVTSSLPIIVGIAGGPIAGAVTWVVDKMISPSISRMVGSSYQIMGAWDRPIVIKLKRSSKNHYEKST